MKARDGVHGVLLHHRTADGHPPVTFAIASQETGDVCVTCCPSFAMGPSSPGGEEFTAKDVWDEVKNRGSLGGAPGAPSSRPGSSIGAAMTVVPAGGTREASFALSWSCPEVKFPAGRTYHRRYTKFLGLDRDAAAEQLAHDALLGEISKDHSDFGVKYDWGKLLQQRLYATSRGQQRLMYSQCAKLAEGTSIMNLIERLDRRWNTPINGRVASL